MKNAKTQKILAGLLATTMLGASLAGCGSDGKEDSKETASKENGGKVDVEITGVRGEGFTPFADCELLQELTAKTNLNISWNDWSQLVQKDKLNLTLNSGELPDAFYGAWSVGSNELSKYGSDGLFMDLTPYINEDIMPNFTDVLEHVDGLKEAISAPTGEIWGLPILDMLSLPKTNDTLLINTEWLEKVNKPMPTTLDELHDVLKAFKEAGDLNGNGKNDEIPLTFRYNEGNAGLFSLMGSTGLVMNGKNERVAKKDGKVVFMPETEEYKEYLTYLNELYADGLIDVEAFTMDKPAFDAKTQTPEPVAGVMSQWSAETVNNMIPGNDPTQDGVYQYMPPLKGEDGVEPVWTPRSNALNGNIGFVVSAKTEHAEELCRWIDLQYDQLTSFQSRYGKIGMHVKDEGDGKFSTIKKENGESFTQQEMSAYTPIKHGVAFIYPDQFEIIDKVSGPQTKAAADEFYEPYLAKEMPNVSMMKTVEEANELSYITPDLLAYVDQMTADFVTNGNIDARWDEYLSHLKDLQSEKYVKIYSDIDSRAK